MFRIRREQMNVFDQRAVQVFEDKAAFALEKIFQRHWKYLGEKQVKKVIRYAVERARSHRFTLDQNILSYLRVVFHLGSDFDIDPQYAWLRAILHDPAAPNETLRAVRLYDSVAEYVDRAIRDFRDADGGYLERGTFTKPMHSIRVASDEPIQPEAVDQFIARLEQELKSLFSHKCHCIGDESIQNALRSGVVAARSHGLATERGTALYVVLTFLLGSGFATDPLVPWAGAILQDPALSTPTLRADRLYVTALAELKRWSEET